MQRLDLAQLTSELEYRQENRRDYTAGTRGMSLYYHGPFVGSDWTLSFRKNNIIEKRLGFSVTPHALSQLVSRAGITLNELTKIVTKGTDKERVGLAVWVTTRLNENPTSCLIRTSHGFWEDPRVVGVLDSRFRCDSSYGVLTELLALGLGFELKGILFHSAYLNDEYMTLKLVNKIEGAIAEPGLMLEYSEVGREPILRPIVVTQHGTIIPNAPVVPIQQQGTIVTLDRVKKTLRIARVFVKRYIDCNNNTLPKSLDAKTLLKEQGIMGHELANIIGRFNKTEMTQRDLVNAISGYAHRSTSLGYDGVTTLEMVAGSVLDSIMWGTSNNGTEKEVSKQGKKPAKGHAKAKASNTPERDARLGPIRRGNAKGTDETATALA